MSIIIKITHVLTMTIEIQKYKKLGIKKMFDHNRLIGTFYCN